MPRKAGNTGKAERDKLRERMRSYGCTVPQIVAEMSRRFDLRPRLAWRHALGWPQWKLALVSFDLGHPHAANTHARTALHCAEVSGYTQVRAFVRWVQSIVAYWEGSYDEAAQLIEAGLPDATSGTTLLRLASRSRPGSTPPVIAPTR